MTSPSPMTSTVMVLGATGMLGHAVFRFLSDSSGLEVVGTARSRSAADALPSNLRDRVVTGVDVESADSLTEVFAHVRPHVVINAVGVVKQLAHAVDPLATLPINALLPHRLVRLCAVARARLIHISTDCVFAGTRGGYREEDAADALDLYGRSKHMGEVDAPHALTLRTSIIGHELRSAHGLVEWFLAQSGPVRGFRRAVFSGVPTVELAHVIRNVVLPRTDLRGVYHLAAEPIAKYDLLRLLAEAYNRPTVIIPDDSFIIDRSLDASRFRAATGYVAAPWPDLIKAMQQFG